MDDEVIPVDTEKPPKERVKLTHSTWAKVGAIVLLYVSLICVLICAACYAASVSGWGDAEYIKEYVLINLDYTQPGAMTVARIVWNVSGFCGASVYVGVVFLLLMLACTIFLFCAAGHRRGETEPRLNLIDRIPLDLYAAAVALADFFLIFVVGESMVNIMPSGYTAIMQYVFLGVFVLCVAFGLILALLLSFATRVKCGKWWRNTVIYRVLRLIWRVIKAVWHGIGRFGRMIPIVWRTALIMLGLFLIAFVLFILMYDSSGVWLLVGLLFSIVIYAAAIFGAWQMKAIKKAGQQLAEGNYNEKIDTAHMYWEFKSHAENLNSIGEGLSKEVAQRMKSERLKTELITNVSHDIKTPLTSIINYADLLQKAKTEEERAEYLDVLIPRDDTMAVVDLVLERREHLPATPRILDLCTGSGCIGLALASQIKGARVTLADLSPAALKIAKKNTVDLRLTARVSCLTADATKPASRFLGQFDVVISNPPYVTRQEMEALPRSVKNFEPAMALFGGEDGLDFYRAIARNFTAAIKPGGYLALEFGQGQEDAVCWILEAWDYEILKLQQDAGGITRAVLAQKKERD